MSKSLNCCWYAATYNVVTHHLFTDSPKTAQKRRTVRWEPKKRSRKKAAETPDSILREGWLTSQLALSTRWQRGDKGATKGKDYWSNSEDAEELQLISTLNQRDTIYSIKTEKAEVERDAGGRTDTRRIPKGGPDVERLTRLQCESRVKCSRNW